MKKVLTIVILAVMLMMVAMTVVNAATSQTLTAELYAIGSKYGMTEAQRVEMERYLRENPLSDADCNRILALAQEADQIMIENGTTDPKSLPADVKAKLKSLANEAADIAGVTLDFGADGVKIKVKETGKTVTVQNYNASKPAYTGNNMNITLVVSAVAVIALAATGITVIARKRLAANA